MARYRGLSAKSSPLSHASLFVLRVGCVAILVFYHAWAEAHAAWHHVWGREPWPLVDQLSRLHYPAPKLLAVSAAMVCALGSVTIVLGFLTRLSAMFILIVIIAAIPVSMNSGMSVHRELHSFYTLGFALIMLLGGGRHALDSMFVKKRAF